MSTKAAIKNAEAKSGPSRDDLVREAQQLGVKGASAMNMQKLTAAVATAKKGAPEAKPATSNRDRDALTETGAFVDRTRRGAAAKEESKALKAWQQGGEKGTRPVTPNYDQIRAEYEDPSLKKKTGRRASSGAGGSRSTRSERGQKARAVELAKPSIGTRKKLSDAELYDYIVKVREAHPGSSAFDEREYAYWIEKLAVRRARFLAMWADVEKGKKRPSDEPPKAKAPAKSAAPAKKATGASKPPAKKAAAKKATPTKRTPASRRAA